MHAKDVNAKQLKFLTAIHVKNRSTEQMTVIAFTPQNAIPEHAQLCKIHSVMIVLKFKLQKIYVAARIRNVFENHVRTILLPIVHHVKNWRAKMTSAGVLSSSV